jgi:hypothetical protein
MLRLKFLEQIHLPLLVTRGLSALLLPLIVHHLLNHGARLAVQVAERRVLWRDLGHVDLGRGRYDVRPPFHLVDLVEVDGDFFTGAGGFKRPGGFVEADGVWEFTLGTEAVSIHVVKQCRNLGRKRGGGAISYIDHWWLSLQGYLDLGLGQDNVQVPPSDVAGDMHGDICITDRLCPFVREGGLFGIFLGLALFLFLVSLLDLFAAGAGRVFDVIHCCLRLDTLAIRQVRNGCTDVFDEAKLPQI